MNDKAKAPHEVRAERLAIIRAMTKPRLAIYQLMLDGYTNYGIAENLGLSSKTVCTQKSRMATALGWPPAVRRKYRRHVDSILFDAYVDALWAEHEENGCFVLPGEDALPIVRGADNYWAGVLSALRIIRCPDVNAFLETQ